MKILLTTVALAVLAASPAFAASHRHAAQADATPGTVYNSYASVPSQANVISDGAVVGRDPDANVRLQLLRDADGYAF
ncbi:MAG: hypothetical protein WA792_04640 [Pseudolabrys sp.]